MMVFVRILDLEIPLECTVVEVASLSASTLAICVLMWNRNTIVLVIYADVAASISKLKIHISLMRKLVSSKYYNEYNLLNTLLQISWILDLKSILDVTMELIFVLLVDMSAKLHPTLELM